MIPTNTLYRLDPSLTVDDKDDATHPEESLANQTKAESSTVYSEFQQVQFGVSDKDMNVDDIQGKVQKF